MGHIKECMVLYSFFYRNPDTLNEMTHPKQMRSNVVKTLLYLDSQLPKGSHVILIGLVNGSFIWDAMHRRYHPLGKYNTYLFS